jgi:hypothetical protein
MVGAAVACGPGCANAVPKRNKIGYKRFILKKIVCELMIQFSMENFALG